ncbi:MAG: AAA family ATPase [Planctomycetota bacterium]
MFILDEPTAGLHPVETEELVAAIRSLTEEHNTVIVVEHDPSVVLAADQVIDLGPGPGSEGGRIVYQGPPTGLAEVEESYTAGYLEPAPLEPRNYRTPRGFLHLEGARRNNLKSIDVKFPLGCLCVVAGVSGSGKSSLVLETLYPAFQRTKGGEPVPKEDCDRLIGADRIDEIVLVDSQAMGRSARSNPATYLQIFDDIRTLFSETLEAKTRGLSGGDFSFNIVGGRCERCDGNGYLVVDMQFLPEVRMACPECDGTRYQRRVLDVKLRGRNIAEVLDLTIRDAFSFFRGQIRIQERLKRLIDVGLEYLRLGQPSATLSGGEAQRLKLATYLSAKKNKRTLFLFEEPTTGLHPADIETLLDCFSALVDVGHSLLVIEHNPQIWQAADHILEFGPGSGPQGGRLIGVGTPLDIAKLETPTGNALRRGL